MDRSGEARLADGRVIRLFPGREVVYVAHVNQYVIRVLLQSVGVETVSALVHRDIIAALRPGRYHA